MQRRENFVQTRENFVQRRKFHIVKKRMESISNSIQSQTQEYTFHYEKNEPKEGLQKYLPHHHVADLEDFFPPLLLKQALEHGSPSNRILSRPFFRDHMPDTEYEFRRLLVNRYVDVHEGIPFASEEVEPISHFASLFYHST